MTVNKKWDYFVDSIINNEHDMAEKLFQDIVKENSVEIYERLLSEKISRDEVKDFRKDIQADVSDLNNAEKKENSNNSKKSENVDDSKDAMSNLQSEFEKIKDDNEKEIKNNQDCCEGEGCENCKPETGKKLKEEIDRDPTSQDIWQEAQQEAINRADFQVASIHTEYGFCHLEIYDAPDFIEFLSDNGIGHINDNNEYQLTVNQILPEDHELADTPYHEVQDEILEAFASVLRSHDIEAAVLIPGTRI